MSNAFARGAFSIDDIASCQIFERHAEYVHKPGERPDDENGVAHDDVNFKPERHAFHERGIRFEQEDIPKPRSDCCTVVKAF